MFNFSPLENHGFRLGRADFYPCCFTLDPNKHKYLVATTTSGTACSVSLSLTYPRTYNLDTDMVHGMVLYISLPVISGQLCPLLYQCPRQNKTWDLNAPILVPTARSVLKVYDLPSYNITLSLTEQEGMPKI